MRESVRWLGAFAIAVSALAAAEGVAAACATHADCTNPKQPICDPTTMMCRACMSNTECTTQVSPQTGLCETSGQFQGECVESCGPGMIGCTGATPVCDSTTGLCVGCATDFDGGGVLDSGLLQCPDPNQPACNVGGLLLGQCTQCSMTDQTLCKGARPVCVTTLGDCGCTKDGDCGQNNGMYCDKTQQPAGACAMGCDTQGQGNCMPGQHCSSTDGGVGQCVSDSDGGGGDGGGGSGGDGGGGDGSSGDGSGGTGGSAGNGGSGGSSNGGSGGSAGSSNGGSGGSAAGGSAAGGSAAGGSAGAAGAGGSSNGGAAGANGANDGGYIEGGGCMVSSERATQIGGGMLALFAIGAFVRRRRRS